MLETGAFFFEQTPAAIAAAVRHFDGVIAGVDPRACAQNAQRVASERFGREMKAFIEHCYANIQAGRR